MPLAALGDIADSLRCPKCHAPIIDLRCSAPSCDYANGFPNVRGQPALIDFDNSIFGRGEFEDGRGFAEGERLSNSLGARLQRALYPENPVAGACCAFLIAKSRQHSARPKLLVIGGGSVGSGVEVLYASADVSVVGTDVYASPNTTLVADAHSLPFADQTFDAVVIQAVLEHVLDPHQVVAEIHRVLKPEGLVYADTPFMQQVHMDAYDFTRFSMSGHRWLFRNFTELAAGAVGGAGTATTWSVWYLLRAAGLPLRLVNAAKLAVFPFRFIDGTKRVRNNADAASAVYFVGRKSADPIGPKDMLAYYDHQHGRRPVTEQLAAVQ